MRRKNVPIMQMGYMMMGSEVHIDMYDDRTEIYSPGGMYQSKPIQEYNIDDVESVRRNPIIADLFHRMKFMERQGSGIKKIFDETAKLPGYTEDFKPEVRSTPASFHVVLKNVNYLAGEQDGEQDATVEKLLDFCSKPRSRQEIANFLQIKSSPYLSRVYLVPLLESGKIHMTLPEKPSSKNQKYIRT